MIYEHYVKIDGGYIFKPESGKMKPATPCAHLLALQYTYKQVAREMRGLALTHNILSFSTVDTMRKKPLASGS